MADQFRVLIDGPQKRIQRDRLFTQITGKYARDPYQNYRPDGWDQNSYSVDGNGDAEVWWEPITGRLMLRPLCMTSQWHVTNAGDYARLLKANFTFDVSGDWIDNNFSNAGGTSIKLKDNQTFETATSVDDFVHNTPFYIAPVFFSTGNDSRGYCEIAYNSSVSFRFYAGGRAEVRKDGTVVGTYSWSSEDDKGNQQKADNQRVSFMIFPMPPNQAVVVTNYGGGFCHTFDDLDPMGTDNSVTPAGKVTFRCNYMNTDVEIAKIKFMETGTAYSIVTYFKDTPPAGDPTITVLRSTPGNGTVGYDSELEASGDGYRFKIDLTGDGDASYYIGALTAEHEPVIEETADEELDITDYVVDLELSGAMAPGSNELRFTIKAADYFAGVLTELDPDLLLQIRTMENRVVKLMLGDIVVMNGIAEAPSVDYSTTAQTERIHFRVRDKQWALLDEYRFTDPTPFDGFTLGESFELTVKAAGNDLEEYEIDPDSEIVTMEVGAMASMGDWAMQAMPKQTGTQVLSDLHSMYAGDWFMQVQPTETGPVLKILSPDSMGEIASVTIYTDAEIARDEVDPSLDFHHFVAHAFNKKTIPAESNQFFVHGVDPVFRRPLILKWEDTAAQDVTTGVAERPENWCGTIRKAAINAPGLRSEDAIQRAGEKIWKRIQYARVCAEWECTLLLHPEGLYPLWVGDCVEIAGEGTFRIQSVRVTLNVEPGEFCPDRLSRRAHYVGELLQDREDSRGLGAIKQKAKSLTGLLRESLDRMKKGVFDIEVDLKPIWQRIDGIGS